MIPGNKLGILLLSRFYLGRHTFDQHTIETTYTGINMRRVLHVGPCNTPGGMAKVIEILSKNEELLIAVSVYDMNEDLGYSDQISLEIASNEYENFLRNVANQ